VSQVPELISRGVSFGEH